MDSIFIIKPSITVSELKEAIDNRLIKARAISSCLLSQDRGYHEPSNSSLHGAIWAIDDYLCEIEYLEGKARNVAKDK